MKHRIISTPDFFQEEAFVINQLFEKGLPCFHLRKPQARIDDCIFLLQQIDTEFYSRIIVHQHFELLDQFDLLGVHLREEVRLQLSLDKLLNLIANYHQKGKKIGSSIHSKMEIPNLPSTLDYTFLSPIFPSISKPAYVPQEDFGVHAIQTPIALVALGGIDESTLLPALKLGFQEVAFLGAIWGDLTNIVENYSKICKKIKTLDLMP